jgi:3-methylfumaryl-CoA hydratase
MWAGSRFVFHQPLAVCESVLRTSTIDDVSEKSGRSGALVFVRVRHDVAHEGGVALTEEHDIVYREAPSPGAPAVPPQRAPTDETFARTIEPDPVLLFRYSALTFNGHRIHYDRDYCRNEEGYPGLVVHGPLIATLLVDLLHRHRPGARLRRFAFKAVRPIFDVAPFEVCGRIADDGHAVRLWARDHEGWLAMEATAELP